MLYFFFIADDFAIATIERIIATINNTLIPISTYNVGTLNNPNTSNIVLFLSLIIYCFNIFVLYLKYRAAFQHI